MLARVSLEWKFREVLAKYVRLVIFCKSNWKIFGGVQETNALRCVLIVLR